MSNEVLKKAVDLLSDELSEYVEAERLRGMLRSVGMSENDIAELGWGEKSERRTPTSSAHSGII